MKRSPLQYSPEINEKRTRVIRKLTLEERLLASPSRGHHADGLNGGELYVFKHFSRRVHPSSSSSREAIPSTPAGAAVDLSSSSSFIRSPSGKPKKKVSFRLPEEAEIVIFYSPEQTFWEC